MVERQRKSAEYWKEIIEDFLKSGVSQKEYEQEHKICRATLLAWSKRLCIPLNQRKKPFKFKIKKDFKIEKEPPLLFRDVQILGRAKMSSPSLKIEIIFPQGHTLKLETEGTWEQAGTFIKALVG